MKKMKSLLSWCIPSVLITVVLMVPAVAEAKSLTIWPDQLKPEQVFDDQYSQDAFSATGGFFYAPVNLPVGAEISKITYYHYAGTSSYTLTRLNIYRIKIGEFSEKLGGEATNGTYGEITPVDVEITGDPVIKAGYRYVISVESANIHSLFLGVKITYRKK